MPRSGFLTGSHPQSNRTLVRLVKREPGRESQRRQANDGKQAVANAPPKSHWPNHRACSSVFHSASERSSARFCKSIRPARAESDGFPDLHRSFT